MEVCSWHEAEVAVGVDYVRRRFEIIEEAMDRDEDQKEIGLCPCVDSPAPWRIEALDGGFKIVDSSGQSLAYV
jgi:hypothetical protein